MAKLITGDAIDGTAALDISLNDHSVQNAVIIEFPRDDAQGAPNEASYGRGRMTPAQAAVALTIGTLISLLVVIL